MHKSKCVIKSYDDPLQLKSGNALTRKYARNSELQRSLTRCFRKALEKSAVRFEVTTCLTVNYTIASVLFNE